MPLLMPIPVSRDPSAPSVQGYPQEHAAQEAPPAHGCPQMSQAEDRWTPLPLPSPLGAHMASPSSQGQWDPFPLLQGPHIPYSMAGFSLERGG